MRLEWHTLKMHGLRIVTGDGYSCRLATTMAKLENKRGGRMNFKYILELDGKEVKRFDSANDALIWLQRNYGQSWHYAFLYGGYSLWSIRGCEKVRIN